MKIAIVTGASSGMGREFAKKISEEYSLDEIWVIARRKERLEELSAEMKTRARILPMDLSDADSTEVLKKLLEQEKPDVKILVNAAGYGIFGEFAKLELGEQLGMLAVNNNALAAMCGICLPYIQTGGSIINLGSNSSWQPVPFMNVYAATKAFVLSFSRGLGRELKEQGIHVMCVCPGWIKTEFFNTAVRDDTVSYYDRFYTAEQVVDRAMRDLEKKKPVSILGFPVRIQVALVKHLPVNTVMNTWCRQQNKK